MSRKAKANGSTALATVVTAPPALQITRAEANARIKARALELYHAARTQRDERIRAFEAEYGRADRIDHSVLADLQRIQARLAAIASRQQRANATGGEPKVAKFVDQIGMMIVGAVSAHLATERALELFAPVPQADYVGWNGSGVGPKCQDDTLLGGYEIVDDQAIDAKLPYETKTTMARSVRRCGVHLSHTLDAYGYSSLKTS